MAIKHVIIKPVVHAGIHSQDRIYIAGGTIVEGAPVIIEAATGKVIEAVDLDAGPLLATGLILGISLHAAVVNQDISVALAVPARRFRGSLTDLAAAAASDGGTKAIALADIGDLFEFHKDDTTLRWVLGLAQAAPTTNLGGRVMALIDKVGATTNDALTFGAVGSPTGVTPSTAVGGPGTTFKDDPTGSNTGQAQVEFTIPVSASIYA